jgi:hypothetical protein
MGTNYDYDAMVVVHLRSRPDVRGQIKTERPGTDLVRAVSFVMANSHRGPRVTMEISR